MSTVSAAPLLLGLVDLDVRNVECINVQTFHLKYHSTIIRQEKR